MSNTEYNKFISDGKAGKWTIPIIFGSVFFVLYLVAAYVLKLSFLSDASGMVSNVLMWIVIAAVMGVLSWLAGFLWYNIADNAMSTAKGLTLTIVISFVVLAVISIIFDIPAIIQHGVLISYVLAIIITINDWDLDESWGLAIAAAGVEFLWEAIGIHDKAFAWMQHIIHMLFAIVLAFIAFIIMRLLLTKTGCRSVLRIIYPFDKVQCKYINSVDVDNVLILYYIDEIIDAIFKDEARRKYRKECISSQKEKLDNLNQMLNAEKSSLEKAEKELGRQWQNKLSRLREDLAAKRSIAENEKTKKQQSEQRINQDKSKLQNVQRDISQKESEKSKLEQKIQRLSGNSSDKISKCIKQLKELGDELKTQCDFDEDDDRAEEKSHNQLVKSKGKLSNILYFDAPNSDQDGFPKFHFIDHNCKKMVLLYDETDVQDGNLSVGLKDYIEIFVEAFYRMNTYRIFQNAEFQIIDYDSNCSAFSRDDPFTYYYSDKPVLKYEDDLRTQKEKLNENSIEDVNVKRLEAFGEEAFGRRGRENIKYFITFILYGKKTRAAIRQDLWSYFAGSEKYGVIPIFFVDKKSWYNEKDNNGIRSDEDIKKTVSKENIFSISYEKVCDSSGDEQTYIKILPESV